MAIAIPRSVFFSSRSILSTSRSPVRPHRRVTRRTLHTRKELPYKIEDGLGNFMSPRTLQMVAEEYQQGLLDRLNEYLRDTDDRRKTIAQVVLDTAERPDKTMTFRYASHALNNSFFLNCLRPPTGDSGETDVEGSVLGPAIRKQFGNFDALRSQFSAAVLGMSGSGYVWFVTDAKGNLAFVPTFAAGTLLVRSRTGTVDPLTQPVLGEGHDIPLPNQNNHHSLDQLRNSRSGDPVHPPSSGARTAPTSPASGASRELPPHPPHSLSRMLHTSVSSQNLFPSRARSVYDPSTGTAPLGFMNDTDMRDLRTIGEYIYPLFCVSVHEHCWLLDHGIWGKEKYMKEFWSALDWQQVAHRFDTFPATGNT
ncbi:hypothetical protein EDD16DRAFT_1690341 [Pisolithus croceorrhizus]|nr:hypothetical protein EDD16DRAFT_1690341 [Pisolithus croceorrhizus]